jgi:hypothetical protein
VAAAAEGFGCLRRIAREHTLRRSLRIAWLLTAALLAAAAPLFVVLPGQGVRHPAAACVLGALALVSYLADRRWALPTWRLEADLPIWFVAVLYCGPLCAFVIVAIPELLRPLLDRGELAPRRIAIASGLASYAWAVLAGALLLRVLPGAHAASIAARAPAYLGACVAMVLLNVGIIAGTIQCIVDGRRLPVRHFAAMLMFAPLAAVIACLFGAFGILALATFAVVSALPGMLVHFATPILAPRAASLDRAGAAERYAVAIAAELGLSRSRRRVVRLAAGWAPPLYAVLVPGRIFQERSEALQLRFELSQHNMPVRSLEAAVVLLAEEWAELTAAGTPELTHTAALRSLERQTGQYAPRALRAAWTLVDAQPAASRRNAVAPRHPALARAIVALSAGSADRGSLGLR